ncbi:beta-glucosidase [Novosphingobium sp. SG751A]|uniref:glycoside hydrolase family 3 protein n=1 Tax=Novosphingobium sp. SG751A TaxID=2587000 RepID=UPI0020A6BDFD|nr:glycoside hydrolase family 3 protein [Novosphingobium sp. SG751A]NOW48731.1 beta-glucosidase [Novosphingobium sp. SG751A]
MNRQWARKGLICGLSLAAMAMGMPVAAQTQQQNQQAQRIADLLAHMSVEHKVAQLIEPDIGSITPEDMRRYRFGTILNGGNSGPGGNDKALAPAWLALADTMYRAGTEPLPSGEPVIPPFWGTDAVHGHNNIIGATLFPHNIGLGAAHDPALVQRIGAATAEEIAVTGIDWAFAPTLAVVKDTRWGRSYESFSEDPALVARMGVAEVEGLQGQLGTKNFLDQRHVLASIKHFFADGGTGGVDQGDTRGDLNTIIATHASAYLPAIKAGAQTVMASFSSINGEKMHGNKALLTDLLRGKMGFDGLLVGDWNAHGQVPGCSNSDCPKSLLAGLDVFMVPNDWRALYDNLLREVRDGTIPMARLDEAVGRVLRVKLHDGLFDKPAPAQRELAGKWELLGSPDHRAVAREAVAKSLVLLKNNGVLPIKSSARILVAGHAADNIAQAAGGWTITWQGGGDLTNADFPGATSIYDGIAKAAGKATLSSDGSYSARPDVAIVVFGEQPYAEFVGDRPDHALHDEEGLKLLRKFKAAHIPTVAVLLSGRPLWVNRELTLADAFVAAWLPGSEGAGIADVLIGGKTDFSGRLPFHWPTACDDSGKPLFGVNYGGSYRQPAPRLPVLGQTCAALNASASGTFEVFHKRLAAGVDASIREGADETLLHGFVGAGKQLKIMGFDYSAQEDARELIWKGPADLRLSWPVADMKPFAGTASGEVVLRYTIDQAPGGPVTLAGITETGAGGTQVDLAPTLRAAAGRGWQTAHIPLVCLAGKAGGAIAGVDLNVAAPLGMKIATIEVRPGGAATSCTEAKF